MTAKSKPMCVQSVELDYEECSRFYKAICLQMVCVKLERNLDESFANLTKAFGTLYETFSTENLCLYQEAEIAFMRKARNCFVTELLHIPRWN